MKWTSLIIPALMLALIVYAAIRRVRIFDSFTSGAQDALGLIFSLFPFFAAILIMNELNAASGVSGAITAALSPVMRALGIPKELVSLLVIKPFSGSGSLAVLSEVFSDYGVDSYIARCAAVVFGSSETTFFIAATYLSKCKTKKIAAPAIISLVSALASAALACLICRFI